MTSAEQTQLAAHADSILDQLRGLLTDQFWIVAGAVALGMVFGIATAGGVRLFWLPLDGDLPDSDYKRRILLLKRWAFGSGTVWTFSILLALIVGGLYVKVLLAIALSVLAGAGVPRMYDLLRWVGWTLLPAVGRWLLDKVRTMLGPKDPPPPPPAA